MALPLEILRGSAAHWREQANICRQAGYDFGVQRALRNACELENDHATACLLQGVLPGVDRAPGLTARVQRALADRTASGAHRPAGWEAALAAATEFTEWSQTYRRCPEPGEFLTSGRELYQVIQVTKFNVVVRRWARSRGTTLKSTERWSRNTFVLYCC